MSASPELKVRRALRAFYFDLIADAIPEMDELLDQGLTSERLEMLCVRYAARAGASPSEMILTLAALSPVDGLGDFYAWIGHTWHGGNPDPFGALLAVAAGLCPHGVDTDDECEGCIEEVEDWDTREEAAGLR
jgi:hypothetical protein